MDVNQFGISLVPDVEEKLPRAGHGTSPKEFLSSRIW